jgi:tetratricopeptide (TPR) repeat protein
MTPMHDLNGLPATTSSTAALAAYDRATDGLLAWDARALDWFREAAAHDPGLALAHAGAGVCLFLEERFEEARAAVETARQAAAGQSERERRHVEAMALLVTGKVREAEAAMREHLDAFPRDLLVFQRLYFIWFWQGRFPEMLGASSALVRWSPGSSYMLGMHAFALEEAGRCDEAIPVARAALARNPRDGWSVHALAHAIYETAAFGTGREVLPPHIEVCTHLNWFRDHLLWHLTLMHFAAGDHERASAMSRELFERQPSSIAGSLHDSISLLWRLMLVGQDVKERWQPFVAIAHERLNRQGLLFHAAHLGMALAGGGDWATGDRQLEGLRQRAPKDRTGLTGEVLVPLIEGMRAFAAGDDATTIARIEPLRPRIVELGGSRAQRDVFHDTLLEACFRSGDTARAGRLCAERVLRRPDPWWVARARAA